MMNISCRIVVPRCLVQLSRRPLSIATLVIDFSQACLLERMMDESSLDPVLFFSEPSKLNLHALMDGPFTVQMLVCFSFAFFKNICLKSITFLELFERIARPQNDVDIELFSFLISSQKV